MPRESRRVGSLVSSSPLPWPAGYTPRVVVKFKDAAARRAELPYDERVERAPEAYLNQLGPWNNLVVQFPGIKFQRLITSVTPAQIDALVAKAIERSMQDRPDRPYHPPNFKTYFAVHCPAAMDPELVARVLRSWSTVEILYIESGPVPPPSVTISPEEAPVIPGQTTEREYLGPAPAGIDAQYAWEITGGDGTGVQFVDMETGWQIDHEDLPLGIDIIYGSNQVTGQFKRYPGHGAAVLGIVLAAPGNANPRKDCVGITPNLSKAMVASIWPDDAATAVHRVNAIWAALLKLNPGDVLLLEDQVGAKGTYDPPISDPNYLFHCPIEVEDAVFESILLATYSGIVIVEAAGNEGINLDHFTPNGIFRSYDIGSTDQTHHWGTDDSGAILVAAAHSNVEWTKPETHSLLSDTNYGSRVNCYAWGNGIHAIGYEDPKPPPLDPNPLYPEPDPTKRYWVFSGTSGAAAIIAGAALAVQGMAKANLGFPLSPLQLRNILSDWRRSDSTKAETGNTLSFGSIYPSDWNHDLIGVMPNLKAIHLNVPDIYIRDFVGDVGNPHSEDVIWASPDIILRPSPDPSPQSYGEGSGNEDNVALSAALQSGKDHSVYVRVRNRGGMDALNVQATVYWSYAATLITPDTWHLIGSAVIDNVPKDNSLTVFPEIKWPWPQGNWIPAGETCFVCLVGNEQDPAPPKVQLLTMSWEQYARFIRVNNNVAWRNFNVVDLVPNLNVVDLADEEHFIDLPFRITGPHNGARAMRLEVVAKLPPNAGLIIQVPRDHWEIMEGLGSVEIDEQERTVSVHVHPHGRSRTRDILFPERLRMQAQLQVRIPKEFQDDSFEVYIRQLYKDQVVGGITWRFVPPRRNQ